MSSNQEEPPPGGHVPSPAYEEIREDFSQFLIEKDHTQRMDRNQTSKMEIETDSLKRAYSTTEEESSNQEKKRQSTRLATEESRKISRGKMRKTGITKEDNEQTNPILNKGDTLSGDK